jgi:hypothetical protein
MMQKLHNFMEPESSLPYLIKKVLPLDTILRRTSPIHTRHTRQLNKDSKVKDMNMYVQH